MPRLNRLYTRNGDEGTTMLATSERVLKNSIRITVIGCIDELNSNLGLVIALGVCEHLKPMISKTQFELFNMGADLSIPDEDKPGSSIPVFGHQHVSSLEKIIDELSAAVGPLRNFILPTGTPAAAQLHIARTVCRRAEREVVGLAQKEKVNPIILNYINRLSDALFIMARYENYQKNVPETLWKSGGDLKNTPQGQE